MIRMFVTRTIFFYQSSSASNIFVLYFHVSVVYLFNQFVYSQNGFQISNVSLQRMGIVQ